MRRFTVKTARVASNLSQQELADKMGVSRNSVSHWENGQKEMTRSHQIAFCSVTGFDEAEIIFPQRSA